jgi:hypothetical protein
LIVIFFKEKGSACQRLFASADTKARIHLEYREKFAEAPRFRTNNAATFNASPTRRSVLD